MRFERIASYMENKLSYNKVFWLSNRKQFLVELELISGRGKFYSVPEFYAEFRNFLETSEYNIEIMAYILGNRSET